MGYTMWANLTHIVFFFFLAHRQSQMLTRSPAGLKLGWTGSWGWGWGLQEAAFIWIQSQVHLTIGAHPLLSVFGVHVRANTFVCWCNSWSTESMQPHLCTVDVESFIMTLVVTWKLLRVCVESINSNNIWINHWPFSLQPWKMQQE